jgi:hypothetical protein
VKAFVPWLAATVIVGVLFGTIYSVAQQIERQGANDGPERLASQVAGQLTGSAIDQVAPENRVDLSRSLAVFYVVYDSSGAPVTGTGFLNGSLATVPAGVLRAARVNNGNRVTWQPSSGLRFATVEVAAGNQIVLAGQSLAPSEARTAQLGLIIGLGWAGSVLLLVVFFVLGWVTRGRTAGTPTPN